LVEPVIIAAIVGGSCALIALASGLRVVREYQRGVVLRLGRRGPLLDPGLRYILPLGLDRLTKVDLRSTPLEVPAHEVITHDGVPLRVSATVHLQVLNPLLAVTRVVDFRASTSLVVHAALRDVVASVGLRELLLGGDAVRDALLRFVETRTEPWGIGVTAVDVVDIALPEAMQRAMARQAELRAQQADREDDADGGREFARQLEATAAILADQPHDVQVRFLQALSDARSGETGVLVVPLPPELVQPFVDLQGSPAASAVRDLSSTRAPLQNQQS
jgi:regulator of protease activity HflC (stomatin/prohibitin superfamily)